MKDYPSLNELSILKEWDFRKKDVMQFLDFLESITWNSDWCFVCKGKNILKFQYHTGGWSGNEDIIEALKSNLYFGVYAGKNIIEAVTTISESTKNCLEVLKAVGFSRIQRIRG